MPTDPNLVREINSLIDGNTDDQAKIAAAERQLPRLTKGSDAAKRKELMSDILRRSDAIKQRNRRLTQIKQEG